jgi:hypothetical protein
MMRLFLLFLVCVSLASAQSTVLSGSTILNQTTKLGLSNLALAPGWTVAQENYSLNCTTTGMTSCTTSISGDTDVFTMTPGSSRFVYMINDDGNAGAHITSAYDCVGAGPCTAANANNTYTCTAKQNVGYDDISICYALNATSASQAYTFNNSAACGTSYCYAGFLEILPQPGYSALFDVTPTGVGYSSCTACTGVSLTNTSTDVDVQITDTEGGPGSAGVYWTGPYFYDQAGNFIYLNAPIGPVTAPVLNQTAALGTFFAFSLKMNALPFTYPPQPFSLVSITRNESLTCNPTCTLTLSNTTGSGHLLVLEAAATTSASISSAVTQTGGVTTDTLTIPGPNGTNVCANSGTSGATTFGLGCGYYLNTTSGATTVKITMSTNATVGATVYEVSRNDAKSFALDAQGSLLPAASYQPSGVNLALTGPDAVFALYAVQGGGCAQTILVGLAGYYFYTLNNLVQNAILLNTANGSPETYCNPQGATDASVVTKIAFK